MTVSIQTCIDYTWLAVLIVWVLASVASKPTVRTQSSGSRLLHIVLGIGGFVLVFDFRLKWGPLDARVLPATQALGYVGLALTIAGLLFAIWARFYLGTNWSASVTVKEGHELIRGGPYSIVRHPIYSGLLFALLGTAIAVVRIRCFIGLVLVAIAFKLKSLLEEDFMQQQFGAQYTSYKREVKALVPFIW